MISGDVRYKPFVTGEPEIKSVPLDGTEDFLVLATDGLTDYLNPKEILTILYHEIQRNPSKYIIMSFFFFVIIKMCMYLAWHVRIEII